MKLAFFDDVQESQSLEFLDNWIKENPKNKKKEFEVQVVQRARSGKGYMLKTTDFIVFIFKNSRICKQIVEALGEYTKRPEGGYPLYIVLTKPNKSDYRIAADKDTKVTWFEMGNGYTISNELAHSKDSEEGNPFL